MFVFKNANTGFHPSILILTSRDNNADYKMIMNMGVSGIISKPFSMDTLLASVERLLADRRTAAERKQLLKYLSKSSAKLLPKSNSYKWIWWTQV